MTDDTIHTALVVDMLYGNRGRVDAMEFIRLLRRWVEHSPKSSAVIGPSTAKAMERIEAGVPMEEAGITGTTNGAAMKILPIGLIHDLAGLDEPVEDVKELCFRHIILLPQSAAPRRWPRRCAMHSMTAETWMK
ncbi:MAG: ADP-ribosylglycohydrolase family protein [Lacrimispora sp.]